jgi:hypothetical protein
MRLKRYKAAWTRAKSRKITLLLPEDVLENALQATGQGITPTIRKGLELVARSQAFSRLRGWRGRAKFSIDLKNLRR